MNNFPHSIVSFKDLRRIFSYDQDLTPHTKNNGIKYIDKISIHDISYSSIDGRQIDAYLVQPSGNESVAGTIFVHPGPGNRSNFLKEAIALAKTDITSLLINAPWALDNFGPNLIKMNVTDIRKMYIQTAIDIRIGLDLILSQPYLTSNRIGYVGHSFGALFGGILSGVEKRIKAYVLMAGVGSFTDVALFNIPNLKGEELEEFRKTMEPIDPINYVNHASPSALFYQFGLNDVFYPRQKFLDYYEAGSDPKSIIWYNADHYQLNDEGRSDRINWLGTQLFTDSTKTRHIDVL